MFRDTCCALKPPGASLQDPMGSAARPMRLSLNRIIGQHEAPNHPVVWPAGLYGLEGREGRL